jgi:hypothetical protein
MLFMVIERFRAGNPGAVGERFRARGRLMPASSVQRGVAYIASWLTTDGSRCYQLMESPDRAALEPWMAAWSDLVEFEVEPVQASAEFWAARAAK